MNPGAEPVIALTLPIGLRYAEERSLASVIHCWHQLKRRASRGRSARLRRARTGAGAGGGADRDRTGDLLVANQALSQLSYSPEGGGPKWI